VHAWGPARTHLSSCISGPEAPKAGGASLCLRARSISRRISNGFSVEHAPKTPKNRRASRAELPDPPRPARAAAQSLQFLSFRAKMGWLCAGSTSSGHPSPFSWALGFYFGAVDLLGFHPHLLQFLSSRPERPTPSFFGSLTLVPLCGN